MTSDQAPGPQPLDLSPAELQTQMGAGQVVLIDVREPFEHAAERIAGAVPMPLGQLDPDALRKQHQGKRVVFHCAGGKRSAKACAVFSKDSNEPTYHLAGGIEAWKQAGLPTVKPSKACAIPVMRQVQIAAGVLVVLGLLLGYFLSPWLYLLSGIVGCGLIFAGVTGFCGMAKLLSQMPWNKLN